MTNIEFLEEHIEHLKEVLFDDDVPKMIVESVETELEYWESILKELKALKIMKLYVDADSFSGLSPENKALLKEVL